MNAQTRSHLWTIIAVVLLSSVPVWAGKAKQQGKEILENARKVSDIRSDGSSPFRMEGTFHIVRKKDRQDVAGTYTEIWVSKAKWRREIQTASAHELEVVSGSMKWTTKSETSVPYEALSRSLTLVFPEHLPDVRHVTERKLDSLIAKCVEGNSGPGSETIDCVDPASGVFLLRESASGYGTFSPLIRHSCVYRNYEKFGDRLFPHSLRCTDESGDSAELTITKLASEPSPDENLFARPAEAEETKVCHGQIPPPRAVYAPAPAYPNHHNERLVVVLWTVVGVDGKVLVDQTHNEGDVARVVMAAFFAPESEFRTPLLRSLLKPAK